MKVLILGSGGREHALGWKLKQSPLVEKMYFVPGNGGTAELGANIAIDPIDSAAVVECCRMNHIDFVVPGSDACYAAGIVDALTIEDIPVFGPTKAAAEIEWSKAYAKEIMQSASVPTARSKTFRDVSEADEYLTSQSFPIVIKADGLALGKGVVIARSLDEARAAIRSMLVEDTFGEAGNTVIIEECLEGIEFSVHALCAGTDVILFPPSQDHKRIFNNDEGPNTGGMGVVVPLPNISETVMQQIHTDIVLPTLRELEKRGRPFNGLLYPGIMLTKEGPKVIEFNARFGDPEAQAYMRLLKGDLLPTLMQSAHGSLKDVSLQWLGGSVACVVMASGGYPGKYEVGKIIAGIEDVESDGSVVFHAGTAHNKQGLLVTNGGRVLNVTAIAPDLQTAASSAYTSVKKISFEGAQYRTDIGAKSVYKD